MIPRCWLCGKKIQDPNDIGRYEGRPAHRGCIEDKESDRYEAFLASGGDEK